MAEGDGLAERFQAHRPRLRAVAYRLLGSLSEADDAVQVAWLRLSRADPPQRRRRPGAVADHGGGAGVPGHAALARRPAGGAAGGAPARPDPPPPRRPRPGGGGAAGRGVGLALLVVMEQLAPAERLALVLHDTFAVPFEEIAVILGRSPAAARQLASRARRRVRASATLPDADLAHQRKVVDAFLAAARNGDLDALVAVLDPDVVVRADWGKLPAGASRTLRGARAVAEQALAFAQRARSVRPALVNGTAGVVADTGGRLLAVMGFTVRGGKIVEIDILADPARLRRLDLPVPHA